MPSYNIAQVNIARMKAPLDDPVMSGFVARLNEINALKVVSTTMANGIAFVVLYLDSTDES